jgi:peptide/nickel transport system substrate-binding protein
MTKNLRRAIAYAINVKDMIGSNGNNGLISQGPIYQSGTVPELSNRIEYNPAEALRLLKADGWGDQDRDGVLDKSGNSLIIKVLVNSRKTIELKILKIIRQQLSEVGIRVEALYFDPEREAGVHFISQSKAQAWLKLFIGPSNEAENYEEVMQWIPGLGRLEDDNGYKNEEVKRIFQLIKSERDDEKRSGLFNRINQIIYDDQPVCFLFYPANFFAVSSRIGNTDEYFTPFMPSYTMKDWRVIK